MSPEDAGRHASNTAVRLVLEHVATIVGPGAQEEVVRLAGDDRPLEVLLDDAGWSSYEQFRALLEAASQVLGGSEQLLALGRMATLTGGSMPSATEMLQALGSPAVLFAEVDKGHTALVTFVDVRAHEVHEHEWLIEYRLRPGFEPFPEFCAFSSGLYPLTPRLFGYEDSTAVEETCQTRGDESCRFRVRWSESDETTRRRITLEQRIELLERRLETFQGTVADLVLAADLDEALLRVVRAAARAIRAPGFVLAVEPPANFPPQVFGDRIPDGMAEVLGERLLAGEHCPEVGEFVVDVVSSRRAYGRLAAYDPDGVILAERPMLDAYARLAATALDSATALESTRQEADRARALLDLSAALAEITTTEAMAFTLAQAVPAVVGADAAAVTLVDEERGTARVAAAWGHDPAFEAAVIGSELPLIADLPVTFHYIDHAHSDPGVNQMLSASGAVATVVMPISVEGETAGWLTTTVFDRPERLAKDPDLEARLLGLAAQASTALRNARLVEQIRHQALHDSLTGLPNRTLILDRAEQMLARARRDGTPMAALFLDLDGFKEINDTLGHAVGDLLLQAVAGRLSRIVRESDTLARLGGDEFVVLVDSGESGAGPELVAERLLDVLREPFTLEGRESVPLTVTASIGIAMAGERTTAGDLLRDADVALYQAKGAGKNRSIVFAPEMQAAVADRLTLEMDLRSALERDELFLVFQPIVDLRDGRVTGVEALLRWEHPRLGQLPPDTFVPLLENMGLIQTVGAWVLGEACRQVAALRSRGHDLAVSVNVSARQLDGERLVADVEGALASAGLPGTALTIELTESAIMRTSAGTVEQLTAIRDLGVRVAIDDFGTGYSSLAYLQQFPVDALKIDRSFVSAIGESREAGALIHTLVHLGKALGLSTLAEGIEDATQWARLREEGCDEGQGYLVARPLAPEDLEAFLAADVTESTSPS
jgi:diguanylate cyclase (GGDEF)-like protein